MLMFTFILMIVLAIGGWFVEETKLGSKLSRWAGIKFFGIDVDTLED